MSKLILHSDLEILNALRDPTADGWALFSNQFDPMIHSIICRPLWRFTEQERQDVLQNIHLQLHKALPDFGSKSSLSWFIKRICHHQCVDEVRRQITRRTWMTSSDQKTPDENEIPATANDPYHEMVQKERRQMLRGALEQLQSTCRESIQLFYIHNLSYAEISERLGVSINTVGSRLSKCLDKLQKELQETPLFKRSRS